MDIAPGYAANAWESFVANLASLTAQLNKQTLAKSGQFSMEES